MQSLAKSFETRLSQLSEESIINLAKKQPAIFNVVRGLHEEAFGALAWDDRIRNFNYHIIYVTRLENKLEGFILKLQPHNKTRNELTTCFTAFICQRYKNKKPHEIFNALQDNQRTLFEQFDYFTYGNELVEYLKGKSAEIFFKDFKGMLFVPFANEEINNNKSIKNQSINYVYIMLNRQNKYHKIGRSIKPEYREKTLQGQEPDVVLIDKWIASADIEKVLHRKYKEKRKRGEWFDLTETDILEIKQFMETIISYRKSD